MKPLPKEAFSSNNAYNRHMKDYTKEIGFWKRLKSFIEGVQVNCAMDEEEKDMILHVCNLKLNELKNV